MAGFHIKTPEELRKLESALGQRHARRLRPHESFAVAHERDAETETLTFDVVEGPEVFRFEARLHLEDLRAPEDSTELLVDFLDAVVTEWLAGDREAYPTLDFSPYEFREVTIGLRGGKHRPDLEAMADAILAGANPHRNGDPHE
ncbi:MAG: hypothetical protein HY904_01585 [Deltaproteobacteria bacterium]|nr:hypothetical protein [Deltaproteobacteria bacterium]